MLGQIVDWFYGQIVGFLGNFFSEMGNMGAELFAMSWVQSVVLFFSYLGWALFAIGLVVACFECGVEYSGGRGNVKETALNAIKGFLAASLFTQVPVRLYELAVSLQADLTAGITGFGTTSIGDAAKAARRVMQSVKKDNSTSVYRHYLNCCEALGVEGMEHAVDQMIVLDYLIANEDRHQNNFGLLRSADTLEWLGAAPIFDSGSSLGYDKLTPQILSARAIECKPFKKTHHEQLKLVTSFGWIDFDRLRGVEQDIRDILDQAGEYMDENRKTAIISAFSSRLGQLMVLAQVQRQEDDVAQDVEQDRAQDYGFKMEL